MFWKKKDSSNTTLTTTPTINVLEPRAISNTVTSFSRDQRPQRANSTKRDSKPNKGEQHVQPIPQHPPSPTTRRSPPIKVPTPHHRAFAARKALDPSSSIFLSSGEAAAFQMNEFDEVMPKVPGQIRPTGHEPVWMGNWEGSTERRRRNIMPAGMEVRGRLMYCKSARQFVIVLPGMQENWGAKR